MKRLIEFVLWRAAADHSACCLAVEEKQEMVTEQDGERESSEGKEWIELGVRVSVEGLFYTFRKYTSSTDKS